MRRKFLISMILIFSLYSGLYAEEIPKLKFSKTSEQTSLGKIELQIIECTCQENFSLKEKAYPEYLYYDFTGRIKNTGTLHIGGARIIVIFYKGKDKLGKDLISDFYAPIPPGGTRVFAGSPCVKGRPTQAILSIEEK